MLGAMILENRLRARSEQQAELERQRFEGPPTGVVPQIHLAVPGDMPVANVSPGAPAPTEELGIPLTTGGPTAQQSQFDDRDPRKRNGIAGVSIGGTQGGVGIRL